MQIVEFISTNYVFKQHCLPTFMRINEVKQEVHYVGLHVPQFKYEIEHEVQPANV